MDSQPGVPGGVTRTENLASRTMPSTQLSGGFIGAEGLSFACFFLPTSLNKISPFTSPSDISGLFYNYSSQHGLIALFHGSANLRGFPFVR